MERLFLGWDAPPLHLLRGYLHGMAAGEGEWDLSQITLVLPTARSAQRLTELLSEGAADDQLRLRLPELVTAGEFPERLYTPRRPFAGDSSQVMAWVRALEHLPLDQLQALVPQPPEAGQLEGWTELGEALQRLHRELSSQRLEFRDVLTRLSDPDEVARWEILVRLQRAYLDELDAVELWDRQTARRVALEKQELVTNRKLIIAFCVDLNETQRAILEAVQSQVTILVASPPDLRGSFDRYGCLDHNAWRAAAIQLSADQIRMAVGPADQAQAVNVWLAEQGSNVSCDEVALGVADPQLVPVLQRRLSRLGLDVRSALGFPILQTAPAKFLALLAAAIERNGFEDWAALARHPQTLAIVGDAAPDHRDWIAHFDAFYQEHLPIQLSAQELQHLLDTAPHAKATGSKDAGRQSYLPALLAWRERMDAWLAPLRGAPRSIATWRRPILQVLAAAYARSPIASHESGVGIQHAVPLNERSMDARACEAIADAIDRLTDIPAKLDRPVTAAYVIRATLDMIRGNGLREEPGTYSIEAVGWLEVPLDDRPAIALTGLNEGIVPQSVGADPFLPSGLRKQLNLEDNERRHSRDAYALQLTLRSGRQVRIIVGRLDGDGRPLAPSRLLFARPDSEIPPRVLRLFGEHGREYARPTIERHPDVPRVQPAIGLLEIPRPEPGRTVDRMSVTSFGDYLRCPYRYYLRHVLKLNPQLDRVDELDPRQIGNLIHDAMEALGKEKDLIACVDAERIDTFLQDQISKRVSESFGKLQNPIVEFQIQQARFRLHAAAVQQAERAAQGWVIRHVEWAVPMGKLNVPDTDMALIGRIDRIDFHPDLNRWSVLDYKTGSSGTKPKQAHVNRNGEWSSLQLPLYRHMADMVDPENVDLGYFLLPPKVSETKIYLAEFSPDELAAADREAARIAKAVQACEFWPPVEPYDGIDDFGAICQSRVQRI